MISQQVQSPTWHVALIQILRNYWRTAKKRVKERELTKKEYHTRTKDSRPNSLVSELVVWYILDHRSYGNNLRKKLIFNIKEWSTDLSYNLWRHKKCRKEIFHEIFQEVRWRQFSGNIYDQSAVQTTQTNRWPFRVRARIRVKVRSQDYD